MKTFRDLALQEAKISLDTIYNNIENPYDDMPKKLSGVEFSTLDDVDVPANIMFYARNQNGKDVSKRVKTSHRAKEVMIAGKSYYVTNKISYPGKKWIKELMFAIK